MSLDKLLLDRDQGIILPLIDFRDAWKTFCSESPYFYRPFDGVDWINGEDFICLPWRGDD